jgi:hypothetical protein
MMAVLDVPVDGTVPRFDEIVQLEDREYLLSFAWSDREACWYLHIYDQDENPLALGIKLVINADLLRRWASDPRMPAGKLVCIPVGPNGDMTAQTDLGTTVTLEYVTSDDESLTG